MRGKSGRRWWYYRPESWSNYTRERYSTLAVSIINKYLKDQSSRERRWWQLRKSSECADGRVGRASKRGGEVIIGVSVVEEAVGRRVFMRILFPSNPPTQRPIRIPCGLALPLTYGPTISSTYPRPFTLISPKKKHHQARLDGLSTPQKHPPSG